MKQKNWDRAPVRIEKISDLLLDGQVYPREQIDRKVVRKYARALKAGSVFPTVKIGLFDGEKIIVDGVHRVFAHEHNKTEYVTCSELLFDNEAELFAESVRLNAGHGKSFTEKEMKENIRRLRKYKFKVKDIQLLTSVPASEIRRDMATPIVTLTTPSGKKKKINCKDCKTVGQPNIHELLQFKEALILIRDVANKGCIPTDDAYFKDLVTQCRLALQKVRLNG